MSLVMQSMGGLSDRLFLLNKVFMWSVIIEEIKVDTRVDNRISADIKQKASKALADHCLSKYWDIPNVETMNSIEEAIDDLKTNKSEGTMSYRELEKLLDE